MRKLVFLLLLVSAVLAWADCNTCSSRMGCYSSSISRSSCYYGTTCSPSTCQNATQCAYECPSYVVVNGVFYSSVETSRSYECSNDNFDGCSYTGGGFSYCIYRSQCSNLNNDSLACLNAGNQWIDGSCCDAKCLCLKEGKEWDESTQSCKSCNDHTNDQTKCDMTWNTGYSTDATGEPGGGGYWQINLYECYYDSCAMSLNCQLKSHFPAGSLTCDDFNDGCQGGDCGRCIASIGSQCTIQCPNNVTINCACDGSCDHAKTVAACRCPEQSSSSGGSSSSGESSSSGGSSSSGEGSSSSMSSSSAQSSSSELPRSSSSPKDSSNGDWEYDYSQVLNEIEYNTRLTSNNTKQIASNTNDIATNTNIAAGYLSSIDKWASSINFNMQAESGQIINAIESGATQVANASNAVADSVGHSNEILQEINSL